METAVIQTTNQTTIVPVTVKSLFEQENVKKRFQEMLGKKSQGFITSVLQIVASNKLLSKADPMSIYNAAAVAATLDLPINNNLGFAYIIPYNERFMDNDGQWKQRQVAQFQLGYKGFIQLAQRSGQFKTISATPILEGQLVEENPLTGFVFDFKKKISDKVIGFAAYFSLVNGFEKTFYMSIEQMKAHGKKYSKTFDNKNGRWELDFEGMGNKTVLKLLLSKFAPLSIEMQKAISVDQALVKNDDGTEVQYIDHEEVSSDVDKEQQRMVLMLKDCKTIEDVELLRESCPDCDAKMFEDKIAEIKGGKK